jgi:pimeloyl-ACP methyl ester carboxylesterase
MTGTATAPGVLERREFDLHGHSMVCHVGGAGPALLLVHGIGSAASTWQSAIQHLADRHSLIVPDLPGHGESANPPGDYSLSGYAAALRDLLRLLGVPRVTLVGHSLGGGIALQSAYLFPELAERLVLVSSGGFGAEVHPLLRAATLPGSEVVLALLTATPVLDAGDAVGRGFNLLDIPRSVVVKLQSQNLSAGGSRRWPRCRWCSGAGSRGGCRPSGCTVPAGPGGGYRLRRGGGRRTLGRPGRR